MQNETNALLTAPALLTDAAFDIGFEEVAQAEKVICRLKPGNPVRKLARNVMNRRPVESVQPLLASLSNPSRPGKERQAAAWALGCTSLDTAEKQAAINVLRDVLEKEQAADTTRFKRIAVRAGICSLGLTLAYMQWLHVVDMNRSFGWVFRWSNFMYDDSRRIEAFDVLKHSALVTTVLSLVPVVPASLALDRKQANKVRAAAALSLGRLQSVGSVGALTSALNDRSAAVRRAAEAALKSVLPLLRSQDYGQLGVQAIPNLCRALGHSDDTLVLHILSALEYVGDGRAVRPVEQLVTSGRTDCVREMAVHVLPVLQERQRQESASKMLLRAAAPTANVPETLLRPVNTPTSATLIVNEQMLPQVIHDTVTPPTSPQEEALPILQQSTSR